jgi:hypothetical protein
LWLSRASIAGLHSRPPKQWHVVARLRVLSCQGIGQCIYTSQIHHRAASQIFLSGSLSPREDEREEERESWSFVDLVEGKVWTFGWVDLTDPVSRRCALSSYIAMNSSTTHKLIDPSFFGGARVATVSTGSQHSA